MPQTDSNPVAVAYATALVELADERSQLDEVADECYQVGELLAHDSEFATLMTSPMIRAEQRRGVLERLFAGKVTDTLYNFLQTLNRKQRIAALRDILIAFGGIISDRRGVVHVTATTASDLPDDQADGMTQRLGEKLGGKHVELTRTTNPALIGGMALRVDDTLVDGSVATQLRLMKTHMIEAGRERARQLAHQAD
ncbi:MAG: ATP synthase F1 subunit delta [Planctomycetota bacterium]